MTDKLLSPTQYAIWMRLAEGKAAKQMHCSRCTCHQHLLRVRRKLGVRTNIQVAIKLTKLGIL